jgi:hypothetical protein
MTQAGLWTAAGASMATVLLAGLADWLRSRRRNLDKPGWVPWPLVQVFGIIAAVLFAAFALKA